jgi:hypothetical protein
MPEADSDIAPRSKTVLVPAKRPDLEGLRKTDLAGLKNALRWISEILALEPEVLKRSTDLTRLTP